MLDHESHEAKLFERHLSEGCMTNRGPGAGGARAGWEQPRLKGYGHHGYESGSQTHRASRAHVAVSALPPQQGARARGHVGDSLRNPAASERPCGASRSLHNLSKNASLPPYK
jgi:hypothetical protein